MNIKTFLQLWCRLSLCDEMVCVNAKIALYCQTFTKWKSEVDQKLKEEKKKQVVKERRAEEAKKEEKSHKRKDAVSAYQQWSVLIVVYCVIWYIL